MRCDTISLRQFRLGVPSEHLLAKCFKCVYKFALRISQLERLLGFSWQLGSIFPEFQSAIRYGSLLSICFKYSQLNRPLLWPSLNVGRIA